MEQWGAKTSINLNADPEKDGPIERIRSRSRAYVIPGEMILFLDAGVRLNITRQSQGQINPAASGISRYIAFQFPYRLLHAPDKSIKTAGYGSPPRRRFPLVFTAFTLRLPYRRYRFFAVFRFSPALRIRWAGRAQYTSFVARSSTSLRNLMREVEFTRFLFQFAIRCFFSFAFLFIVPSEGLANRMAKIGEDSVSPSPLPPVRVGRRRFRPESEDRVKKPRTRQKR